MVTETFTIENEVKNPSPHYNCLHGSDSSTVPDENSKEMIVL